MARKTIAIVSDIHYAGAAEQARGDDYEIRALANPLLRFCLRTYRRYVWLHQPLRQNYLLDAFLRQTVGADLAVANGDYSCDSAFIGVSDPAAGASASECLGKLRSQFGNAFLATFGDHELGKKSLVGGRGGMRLASWEHARENLKLDPLWQVSVGRNRLIGVTSSLIALPVFEPDTLPEERSQWHELRAAHLEQIRQTFAAIRSDERILLFCHDPTALPFLGAEPKIRSRMAQVNTTFIGHLHSPLILRQARAMAGLPRIPFLGNTVRRLSTALREARHWEPFKVRLCPSLSGLELVKDGGYYLASLDLDAHEPAQFYFRRLAR